MTSLLSNPPYNIKWEIPDFAQVQERFCNCELPPKSNANFAFILTGLNMISQDGRAVFILPNSVLTTDNNQEKDIKQYLVDKNLIDSVILCPDKMFESTSISTCIIVFDKNKKTQKVAMIDMRNEYKTEMREQNGQYGGASHEGRKYKKEVKVFSDENMEKAIQAIRERKDKEGFCKFVSAHDIKNQDYKLSPSLYIPFNEVEVEVPHREYKDIISDINRVIRQKNCLKLTLNETVAKSLGLYDLCILCKQSTENTDNLNAVLSVFGGKIEKENYIRTSKNKNEFKFENHSKSEISTILLSVLQMWKQHIMYLNTEENIYLAELRDALLPDLMSGKINVEKTKNIEESKHVT